MDWFRIIFQDSFAKRLWFSKDPLRMKYQETVSMTVWLWQKKEHKISGILKNGINLFHKMISHGTRAKMKQKWEKEVTKIFSKWDWFDQFWNLMIMKEEKNCQAGNWNLMQFGHLNCSHMMDIFAVHFKKIGEIVVLDVNGKGWYMDCRKVWTVYNLFKKWILQFFTNCCTNNQFYSNKNMLMFVKKCFWFKSFRTVFKMSIVKI